ncbi:MAG: Kelch repeat-containing protein [Candidatus Hodarchaeales archaeon]|jgi:hypothetical protein
MTWIPLFLLITFSFTIKLSFAEKSENLNQFRPSGRMGHAMIFDSINNRSILFGGTHDNTAFNVSNEVWIYTYSNNSWQEIETFNPPPGRYEHGMVFNEKNASLVIFGGFGVGGIQLIDTWLLNLVNLEWTQVDGLIPSVFDRSAYLDMETQGIIQYGGFNGIGSHSRATWLFNFQNFSWNPLDPLKSPPGRYGSAITFDSDNQRGLLFGGRTYTNEDDMWEYQYEQGTWEQLNLSLSPPKRYWHTMVAYEKEAVTILFGGIENWPSLHNDTWIFDWNLNFWTKTPSLTGPSPRSLHAASFDITHDKMILFGGSSTDLNHPFDDTWIYDYLTNTWFNPDEEVTRNSNSSASNSSEIIHSSESDLINTSSVNMTFFSVFSFALGYLVKKKKRSF